METKHDPSPGDKASPPTLPDSGKNRREIDSLDSFKMSKTGGASTAGRPQAAGGKAGKPPKKIGRPPKNLPGISGEKMDTLLEDTEMEACREEFEGALIYLLVTLTDGWADESFKLLCSHYPEAEARALSDKAKLTEREKQTFGKIAIRLWRKYVGDKYLFTDEGLAAVIALNYSVRNLPRISLERKLKAKNDKQSRLQSPPRPSSGGEQNGKEHVSVSPDLHASR